jgi:predicted TIM-barrel fold metal-dependent hydrolase
MDESGIRAEVIYPNLLGFMVHAFLAMDPELRLASVRAYNDFLIDFASVDPSRFILLVNLPFWDVAESVKEIERCHDRGFRGVIFPSKPYRLGFPALHDSHWAPLFRTAEERGLSVNFHIGFQEFTEDDLRDLIGKGQARATYAKDSALTMLGLAEVIGDVLTTELCVLYPELKFVLVESGFGWLPYFIEALDWQWVNTGAMRENPSRELPSFYFKRNVFSTFWFERTTIDRMVDLYPDNIMFETDFPHSTSLSPGPASSSEIPRLMADAAVANLAPELARKVLHDNAARLYHLG